MGKHRTARKPSKLPAAAMAAGAIGSAAAVAAPHATAATVFTLDPASFDNQTQYTLQGKPCAAPNTCVRVDYPNSPGVQNNATGAANLDSYLRDTEGDKVAFGYSQGGQVIYAWLRDQGTAPDAPPPGEVKFISIGNPERKYGGFSNHFTDLTGNVTGLPEDTPYQVTDIARQYDGFADFPDDPTNVVALANAVIGMYTVHLSYRNVNPDDPNNVTWTEGNVTYVLVPTDIVPLAYLAGPFAPLADNILRPIIEQAYDRPVDVPDPTPEPTWNLGQKQQPSTLTTDVSSDTNRQTTFSGGTNTGLSGITEHGVSRAGNGATQVKDAFDAATQRAKERRAEVRDSVKAVPQKIHDAVDKVRDRVRDALNPSDEASSDGSSANSN